MKRWAPDKRALAVTAIIIVASLLPYIILLSWLNYQGRASYFHGNSNEILNYFYTWSQDKLGTPTITGIQTIWPFGVYFYVFDHLGISPNASFLLLMFTSTVAGIFSFSRVLQRVLDIPYGGIANVIGSLFFFYNIYVAVILKGSFLFVIAHALTAVYLYLLAESLTRRDWRFAVAAALALSLIAPTNLVYAFIALLAGIIIAVILKQRRQLNKIGYIRVYIIHVLIFVLSITWILVPMAISSRYSAGDAQSVITSEGFYNNDTTPLNVLRGLGYWSFFSGHNGQPYYDYSEVYRHNPIILISLFMPLTALVLMLLRHKHNALNDKTIKILLLALLLNFTVIGGTNPEWFTSELYKYGFENYPITNIFRNTYKFTSLTIMLFAFVIALFVSTIKTKKMVIIFSGLVLAAAFPLALNMTPSDKSLIKDLPDDWKSAKKMLNEKPPGDRALLMPGQYLPAFNWNGKTVTPPGDFEQALFNFPVAFSTCDGCASDNSISVLRELTDSYESEAFVPLARQLSIDSIIQRNDFDSSYLKGVTTDEVSSSLFSNQDLEHYLDIGNLSTYKINDSLPLIYSSRNVVQTTQQSLFSLLRTGDRQLSKSIIVSEDSEIIDKYSDTHDKIYQPEGTELTNGKLNINLSGIRREYKVHTPDPEVMTNTPRFEIRNESKQYSMAPYPLQLARTDISEADNKINSDTVSIICNVANIHTISQRYGIPRAEGYTSPNCKYFDISVLEKDSSHVLSLDVQSAPSAGPVIYCILLSSGECLSGGIVPSDKAWNTYATRLTNTMGQNIFGARLLIITYKHPNEYPVQTRNITLFKARKDKLDSTPMIYINDTVRGISYDIETMDHEIISDTTFSGSEWVGHDFACSGTGENSYFDTGTTNNSLILRSNNALACSSIKNIALANNVDYKVSIDAKVEKGDSFGFCVSINGACKPKHFFQSHSNHTETYEYLFTNDTPTFEASVYLYSALKGESEVAISRVSIKPVKDYHVPRFILTGETPSKLKDFTISNIARKSPTNLSFNIEGNGSGIVVFQESISNGWKLTVNGRVVKSTAKFMTNFFSNGWLLNLNELCDKDCQKNSNNNWVTHASLEYIPQNYVPYGIWVSIAAYTTAAAFIVAATRRYRNRSYVLRKRSKYTAKYRIGD